MKSQLVDEFKLYQNHIQRLHLRIACRTAVWQPVLEEGLKQIWGKDSVGIYELAPLRLSIPLPLEEEAHQKAVVAGRVLVECSEPNSWVIVWSAIQQDTNFGRTVFETVANRYVHGFHLKLTETQLANLYIWLVCQYPHAEDPDHSNEVLAHNMDNRESLARLRDSILTQLRETGTSQACIEIERIADQFPKLTWLKRTLRNAENVRRRKDWQAPKPEQILQIVSNDTKNQSKHVNQIGVFITMPDSNNPIINFNNPVNAANINSTINGDQIQHNYAPEKNLIEAFKEIQQIVNRITQNYPTQTEVEKQIIIAEAVEQVKQNPTLRKRLELGGKAFIFEGLQKVSDQWWVAPFVKAIEAAVKGE